MDGNLYKSLTNFPLHHEPVLKKGESIFNDKSPKLSIGNHLYQERYNEKIGLGSVFDAINNLTVRNDERTLDNDDLLYIILTRLIFTINRKIIFKQAVYTLNVEDEFELAIDFHTNFYDFFRIKVYFDSEKEEDIDIFLSYRKDGKTIIRQGNFYLIGDIINELEINNSL